MGWGVKAFRTKLPRGPLFGFHYIFINKFFKNLPGGAISMSYVLMNYISLIDYSGTHNQNNLGLNKSQFPQCSHSLFWGKSFFKENVSVLCDHILSEIDFYRT